MDVLFADCGCRGRTTLRHSQNDAYPAMCHRLAEAAGRAHRSDTGAHTEAQTWRPACMYQLDVYTVIKEPAELSLDRRPETVSVSELAAGATLQTPGNAVYVQTNSQQ